MEWVEITGRTVEEAKEAALDQLGVDDRRRRVRGPRGAHQGPLRPGPRRGPGAGPHPPHAGRRPRSSAVTAQAPGRPAPVAAAEAAPPTSRGRRRTDDRHRERGGRPTGADDRTGGSALLHREAPCPPPDAAPRTAKPTEQGDAPVSDTDVDLDAHTAIVSEFLDRPGRRLRRSRARVEIDSIDEDTTEVQRRGRRPRSAHRPQGQHPHRRPGALPHRGAPPGARHRRRPGPPRRRPATASAAVRPSSASPRTSAEQVKAVGVQKALEPMNPADRKVVHDTVQRHRRRQHPLRGRRAPPPGGHRPRLIADGARPAPIHRRPRSGGAFVVPGPVRGV